MRELIHDIDISKAAYFKCMRHILLWLGVICCSVLPWAQTSSSKLVLTQNVVGSCADAWLPFLSILNLDE